MIGWLKAHLTFQDLTIVAVWTVAAVLAAHLLGLWS